MPVALVTGFEPYSSADSNPSGELARALDGTEAGGVQVVGAVLPVSRARTPAALLAAIDDVQPDVLLMLGVWPGKHALQVERVAVNVLDFPFPDNDGEQPVDEVVVDGGPAAYFSRIEVRAVLAGWRNAELPGTISNSAGTYLCNQSFYLALHHLSDRDVPIGFVHLPETIEAAARHDPPQPGLPLATLAEGVKAALEAVVESSSTPATGTSHSR